MKTTTNKASSSSSSLAKPKRTTSRVTDFFSRSQPSSSQPSSSFQKSSQKVAEAPRTTALMQKQPSSQSQSHPGLRLQPSVSSQVRAVKKENAPPAPFPSPRTYLDHEVISISSSSDVLSYISIRSTSPSVIEIPRPAKAARRRLTPIDLTSSPPPRRRSPRLMNTDGRSKNRDIPSQPCKLSPKKRKKPEGVQSDDGEPIDLTIAPFIVIKNAFSTPTPPPPARSRQNSSRKRARTFAKPPVDASSSVEEVIPSSQSDEQELSILKKKSKDLEEVKASVIEWQLSSQSQSDAPPESSGPPFCENYDGDVGQDFDFDFDFDHPLSELGAQDQPSSRSSTPSVALNVPNSPSHSTPRQNSQLYTPSKSSPTRKALAPSIPIPAKVSSSSRIPSLPPLSAASSTRVDTPLGTPLSPPTEPYALVSTSKKQSGIRIPSASSPRHQEVEDIEMDEVVVLMDTNQKTNEIVERIKAEARAKAMAMPDEDSINQELGVLGDSDSDSDLDGDGPVDFTKLSKAKQPAKASNDSRTLTTITDGESLNRRDSPISKVNEPEKPISHTKSTLRQARRLSSPASSSTTSTRTRKAPNMRPTTFTGAANALTQTRKKTAANPITKFVREMERHDRFERNCRPIQFDATGEPVSSGSRSMLKSQNTDEGDIENIVGEADRERLLGGGDAKLDQILESYVKEKMTGKVAEEVLGVPLWETQLEESMDVDKEPIDLPRLEILNDDSTLDLLKRYVDAGDVKSVTLMLQSGLYAIKDAAMMEWLFEIAICSPGKLGYASHTVLEHICDHIKKNECFTISLSPVLKLLSKFGARSSVLELLEVEVPTNEGIIASKVHRSAALWRLSELFCLFATKKMLNSEDVPFCVVVLLAVGLDVQTEFNLRLSLKSSLGALIKEYCEESEYQRGEMEREICAKILPLIVNLNPANKVYLLSYIGGCSWVERRIAQWIAFVMLSGDYGAELAKEHVDGPPSLLDVMTLLNPQSQSGDMELQSDLFLLRSSDNEFDYTELGYHIEVLSCVLMNIPQYVQIEKNAGKEKRSQGDSHFSSKLEIIKVLLDRLNGGIVDTRGAHPDRSHVKALIQQLGLRIQYQRTSTRSRSNLNSFLKST